MNTSASSRGILLTALLALFLAAGWSVTSWAEDAPRVSGGTPLEATRPEIAKFYGPVLRANARVRNHQILDGSVLDGDLHGRNGLVIRVVYHQGRCVLLEYTRATGQLTMGDANLLLASNAGSVSWEQGKNSTPTSKFFRRVDDRAVAHWTSENDGSLLVSAEERGHALGGGGALLP